MDGALGRFTNRGRHKTESAVPRTGPATPGNRLPRTSLQEWRKIAYSATSSGRELHLHKRCAQNGQKYGNSRLDGGGTIPEDAGSVRGRRTPMLNAPIAQGRPARMASDLTARA